MYPTTLFVAPKLGGILQSSGFLDLGCLMSLSQTCKAHAFDELSLIQLIESEITKKHVCRTMEEAIHFLREVYRYGRLKQWLNRDNTVELLIPTVPMMSDAAPFDVMLVKMLHSVPESQRLKVLGTRNLSRRTVLHCVAEEGNIEGVKAILNLYAESEQRLQAVNVQDACNTTALHYAAYSTKMSMKGILELLPESERIHALEMQDNIGQTVLHCAAEVGNLEAITDILTLYPESERLRAVCTPAEAGITSLHHAAEMDNTMKTILGFLPEAQRLQAVCTRDGGFLGRCENALFWAARANKFQSVYDTLCLLRESDRWHLVNSKGHDNKTVLDLIGDREALASIMELLPKGGN